jgi:hypothetical protein
MPRSASPCSGRHPPPALPTSSGRCWTPPGSRTLSAAHPPIVYRVLPPPGLPLQEVLDQAFEIEPALALFDRAGWTPALQDVLAARDAGAAAAVKALASSEGREACPPRRRFARLLAASLALAIFGAAALALHNFNLLGTRASRPSAAVEQTTASAGNGSGAANGTPDPADIGHSTVRQAPSAGGVEAAETLGSVGGTAVEPKAPPTSPDTTDLDPDVAPRHPSLANLAPTGSVEAGIPAAEDLAMTSSATVLESGSTGTALGPLGSADDLLKDTTLPDPTSHDDPWPAATAVAAHATTDNSLLTAGARPSPESGIALESTGSATLDEAPSMRLDEIAPREEAAAVVPPPSAPPPDYALAPLVLRLPANVPLPHPPAPLIAPGSPSMPPVPEPEPATPGVAPPPSGGTVAAAPFPQAPPDKRRQERQQPGPTAEVARADGGARQRGMDRRPAAMASSFL